MRPQPIHFWLPPLLSHSTRHHCPTNAPQAGPYRTMRMTKHRVVRDTSTTRVTPSFTRSCDAPATSLQVKFATEIPYPWDDEREEAAEEMFKQACREIGVPQDFHTLTDKDIKLVCSTELSSPHMLTAQAASIRGYRDSIEDPAGSGGTGARDIWACQDGGFTSGSRRKSSACRRSAQE